MIFANARAAKNKGIVSRFIGVCPAPPVPRLLRAVNRSLVAGCFRAS